MRLLERDHELAELERLWGLAIAGQGALVLLGGNAGIGKTTVARTFCQEYVDGRVLWGSCEPVGTPRPLAPLLDVAQQAGGTLAELVGISAAPERLFPAALGLLGDP